MRQKALWMQLFLICILVALAGCGKSTAKSVLLEESDAKSQETEATSAETPVIQVTCTCQCEKATCQEDDAELTQTDDVPQSEEGGQSQDAVGEQSAAIGASVDSGNMQGNTGTSVPQVTEAPQVQAVQTQVDTGKVNINTADVTQLTTLTGIGEKRAQDIISYRQTYGAFQNIEEIKNVSGIKDGIYNKIKEDITV